MKVLYYNHCYGFQARRFLTLARTHFWHFLGRIERKRSASSIESTLELIQKEDPDLLILSEVFGETQRLELKAALQLQGYDYFSVGQGHRFGAKSKEHVELLLASKMPIEKIQSEPIDAPPVWGQGGGILCVRIPDIDCTVIAVHLAHNVQRSQASLQKQMKTIEQCMNDPSSQSKRVLLLGDMNVDKEYLPSLFHQFDHYSVDLPTCSATPIARWFCNYCLDHILGRGFTVQDKIIIEGASDHRAIASVLDCSHD